MFYDPIGYHFAKHYFEMVPVRAVLLWLVEDSECSGFRAVPPHSLSLRLFFLRVVLLLVLASHITDY